jgi:hypothetical protein
MMMDFSCAPMMPAGVSNARFALWKYAKAPRPSMIAAARQVSMIFRLIRAKYSSRSNLPALPQVLIYMTEQILYRLFLTCLIVCASIVLGTIWLEKIVSGPLYFKTAATFFDIGLGSFLVWFSLMLYALRKNA